MQLLHYYYFVFTNREIRKVLPSFAMIKLSVLQIDETKDKLN